MSPAQFAADRADQLSRLDDELEPVVAKALGKWSSSGRWYAPVVDKAKALFHQLSGEDAPAAFARTLRTTLAKTKNPADTSGDTAQRLAAWVSVYVANAAEHSTAGVGDFKRWHTMHDDKVRASHRVLDGKTIPSGEKFDVAGDKLSHPGEPVGDPAAWINCRCLLQVLKEDEMALTAAAPAPLTDDVSEDVSEPTTAKQFHGVAAPTDVPTGDGRQLSSTGFAIRELPLPLFYQRAQGMGHEGSVIVGQLTSITLNPTTKQVEYEGTWNSQPESAEAQQGVDEGWLRGVSVDLDDIAVDHSAEPEVPGEDASDLEWQQFMDAMENAVTVFSQWRIAGLTIVGIPAFQEAYIAHGPMSAGVPASRPAAPAGAVVASAFSFGAAATAALAASGTRALPPAAWFQNPGLDHAIPVTVTDEGQVYGYLAKWGTCHLGFADVCKTAPTSPSNYSYFRTGLVATDEGMVPVGQITLGTGHPDLRLSASATSAHYDNTGSAVADIATGEDGIGIWVAGAMRASATAEQRAQLQAAKLSGDWRSIGGSLELVAALAVNVPGFPIPRVGLAASAAHQDSLVAAGIVAAEDQPPAAAPAPSADAPADTEADTSDERIAKDLRAIDASIDSAVAFLNGIGDDVLGPTGQQARDLAVAADDVLDQLMRDLGIPDPEDEADQPGEPLEPGDAAALEVLIASAVRAALARRDRVAAAKARLRG